MGVQKRKLAMAPVHINKSGYIGMEVEHSNDTSGDISSFMQKRAPNVGVEDFNNTNLFENGKIREIAFKK